MTLNKVEVRSNQGVLLTLDLFDISSGYVVEDISGLDPVDATLVSSSFAQLDGEQQQSSKRGKRNMVFKIGYEPDYSTMTVSELRSRLYGFFMPKSEINLRLYADGFPPVDIKGTVEKFNSPLFVKDPTATISVINFDSDFIGDTVTVNGITTAGTNEIEIPYAGTIETGFIFRMPINRTLPEFTMYRHAADDTQVALEFIGDLVANDVLEISTVQGSKYATRTRAGANASVLYGVSPYSNWIELYPGLNKLRVAAEGAAIPYSITYVNKFGGL